MIETYLTGIFPHPNRLVKINRAYKKGRASGSEVEEIVLEETKRAINLQADLGLTQVIDPMFLWKDILRCVAYSLGIKNVDKGGVSRWFETNTFYRKPVIENKMEFAKALDVYLHPGLMPKDRKRRVVLPSPFTFICLSENKYYRNDEEIIQDLAEYFRKQIQALNDLGFSYFQFNDPVIVQPDQHSQISLAIKVLNKSIQDLPEKIRVGLYTYFGSASGVAAELIDAKIPFYSIGVDFYSTSLEELARKMRGKFRCLAFGCIDFQDPRIENPEKIADFILKACKLLKPEEIEICSNTHPEYLPYSLLKPKITAIVETAEIVESKLN